MPLSVSLGLLVVTSAGGTDAVPQEAPVPNIVNGSDVGVCGWPTTVTTGGCTATLIHPKAVSTAQHCGTPRRILLGENRSNPQRTVGVLACVGTGSRDAMICELAEEVTDIPVTPVLFGCEVDAYMRVGQPVVIVGFGQTSYGVGGGIKLWANQTITAVEPGRTIIGSAGDGTSPCSGDSGGPVFVQVSDGSWRVFGTVLGGTTNIPCNSAANFQRIDRVVAHFEARRGVDITPCFDGATGAWEPTVECGEFFAGDHTGAGTWTNGCAGTPASGYSTQCGPGFNGGGAPDAGFDGGLVPDAGFDGGLVPDAGFDGGLAPDAGFDGGLAPDAGFDGGPTPDAGIDGGIAPDAGIDGGIAPDASTDAGRGTDDPSGDGETGCGCRVEPRGAAWTSVLGLLYLGLLVRRRR